MTANTEKKTLVETYAMEELEEWLLLPADSFSNRKKDIPFSLIDVNIRILELIEIFFTFFYFFYNTINLDNKRSKKKITSKLTSVNGVITILI